MNVELLVDSRAFWDRLTHDLAGAGSHAYLQSCSFEGDAVGSALARTLEACPAPDRRLLVDGYSLLYQNDRLIPGPAMADPAFRAEFRSTHAWVRHLRDGGVGVRFCNPLGPSPVRLLRRNHKKLVVVDDRVAYLGGINFCDHNFEWHDAMLRVESPELAQHLAGDFRATWNGVSLASDRTFGPLRVISLNGRGNPEGFAPVLEAMEGANRTIDVVSAYLSPPFSDHLAKAAARGVTVRVLTPDRNNKSNLARHVMRVAHRHGFQVFRYPHRMNHLKAMLVDGETLVMGSSNFDFMSYHILEELFVMTRDPAIVDAFLSRVWEPDTWMSQTVGGRRSLGTVLGHGAVWAGSRLAAAFAVSGG